MLSVYLPILAAIAIIGNINCINPLSDHKIKTAIGEYIEDLFKESFPDLESYTVEEIQIIHVEPVRLFHDGPLAPRSMREIKAKIILTLQWKNYDVTSHENFLKKCMNRGLSGYPFEEKNIKKLRKPSQIELIQSFVFTGYVKTTEAHKVYVFSEFSKWDILIPPE